MSEKINEVLTRSIDSIYPNTDVFKKLLESGKKLRVYMGIDPTATYVHLGHATNYIILKRLHQLGHKIIVLVGDFTAMIGDPSDKTSARRRLTKEEVDNNLVTFKDQIGKILDFSASDNPIEFRLNSQWLSKLKFDNIVDLAANFTVQQMIERDVFERRLKERKPLFVSEFLYPLMQGYDSVALDADVEIGGTDQTFNMLAGRTLVKNILDKEKIVVATTLLENPKTGEKLMSKSKGTGIALSDDPIEMFGKVMALPDEAIAQVFVDCTYKEMSEIKQLEKELEDGKNPRDVKVTLAKEIVSMYCGEEESDKAHKEFEKVFSEKQLPTEITGFGLKGNYPLPQLILEMGLAASSSEARRLIQGNAVEIDGAKITDITAVISTHHGMIVKVGKRRFAKIK